MKCFKCGKSTIVYRANEKGKDAIWLCESCMGKWNQDVDEDVKEICEITQEAMGEGKYVNSQAHRA